MTESLRQTWNWGDRTRLADGAGITKQYLCRIMRGKATPTKATAMRLEQTASDIGLALTAEDLLFPERSFNPLIRAAREG